MIKKVQRLLSGILAAVMVVLMIPSVALTADATQSAVGGFLKNYTLTGNGAEDIVAVAMAQVGRTGSQLGYTEQWCANFVSDCAILAGQTEAVPQNGLVSNMYAAVMNAGGTITTSNPQPGDLVFVNWNGGTSMTHVEIVYDVSGGSIYSVSGNSGSGDSLYTRYVRKHAPLMSSAILKVVRPAYVNQVTDYLSLCTYYPAHAQVTAKAATLWSIPCTNAVSSEAAVVAKLAAGEKFTAVGVYLNTKGEYWYNVHYNGQSCYLYGGDTTAVNPIHSDISIANVVAPSSVTHGLSFSIAGTITTEYSALSNVTAWISNDNGVLLTGTADLNTKYFSMRGSTVDKGLKFGTLAVGTYDYEVCATVSNYHTEDGKTLTYTSWTHRLHETPFKVVPASDTRAPVITGVSVEDLSESGYVLMANITDDVELETVNFSTWTADGGQDDLRTVSGDADGDRYSCQVLAAAHNNESGTYITRITAVDYKGNTTVQDVEVAVPAPAGVFWDLDSSGTLTISGNGPMDDYASKTAMPWYSRMAEVRSVVIESGVTSIGDYAFYGMTNLETVRMADSVTSIGEYAFKNSTALKTVTLPEGLTNLGDSAFYGCSALSAITIPASLWTIQGYTFKNCTGLKTVTFREGNLMKISDSAFYNTGLTALELPDCLNIVDVYAFKNCSDLASIELGSGLTELREAVFYGTAISRIDIPEGITKIGPYAFKNADRLTDVTLPSTLTSVGEAAFYACTALKTVQLPDKVTVIGNYAFRKCTGLTDVAFGTGLTGIGESSFYGCTGLKQLHIPEGVTTIEGYAFKACTALTEVSLPGTLATLGDSAFHTCTGLTAFTVPAGVKTVGEYCLSGCTGIGAITFQGDAPAIGTGAFSRIVATAEYPGGNATWTADVMQNYGGTITWSAR